VSGDGPQPVPAPGPPFKTTRPVTAAWPATPRASR
jgi:hypothetical protein